MNNALSLDQVVARFNAASPVKRRDKRTVQRWMQRRGIVGHGSSRHNWFYDGEAVAAALAEDFPFTLNGRAVKPAKQRRAP